LAERGEFSGAVAVFRNGRIVYANGFGLADAGRKIPFGPETLVDTGSIAKPVTAAAVLRLVEQNRLRIDAPVQRYVPEYPHRGTTVRQLLMHSGGLPDYGAFDAELNSGKLIRTVDLLELVRKRNSSPTFEPGTKFAYCNICYDTLALAVERVSGEAYFGFVRRHFFEPTGATRAFLRPGRFRDWNGMRMQAYRRTETGTEPNDAFDNEGFYGGSNIYFSALDLAAWSSAWAISHPSLQLVADESRTQVGFPDGASGLSLGNWYCSPSKKQCYYPGHHQGFHAFGYWDSERGLAVALVSNGTLSPPLQTTIPRLLIQAAEGRNLEPLLEPSSDSASVDPGRYRVVGIGTVRISRSGAKLNLRPPGGTSYELVGIGSGWQYAPGLDVYVKRASSLSNGILWWSVFHRGQGRNLKVN
jgi:CubicO group peptidase (beta-lactamase class C family)